MHVTRLAPAYSTIPPETTAPGGLDPLDTYLRPTAVFAEFGIRLHTSTTVRWIKHGRGGVKLDAKRVGGRWYCTRRAALQFINARSNHDGGTRPPTPSGQASGSRRQTAAVLDALGL